MHTCSPFHSPNNVAHAQDFARCHTPDVHRPRCATTIKPRMVERGREVDNSLVSLLSADLPSDNDNALCDVDDLSNENSLNARWKTYMKTSLQSVRRS